MPNRGHYVTQGRFENSESRSTQTFILRLTLTPVIQAFTASTKFMDIKAQLINRLI